MKNKKSLAITLLVYFIFFSKIISYAQLPDTLFKVPLSPFLSKICTLKELNASILLSNETKIIPLQNTMFAPNAQTLYKSGDDTYVLIGQTGFVYKLIRYDSLVCLFRRIDHTVNVNYNINCINFIYNKEIYSYGGYGFWKGNGLVRKFNFQDSEWDILPLNQEIMATEFMWFSVAQGRLYIPFQRIINAGIKGVDNVTGVTIFSSYYLDLASQQWKNLGDLTKEVIKIVRDNKSNSQWLTYQDGVLFLSNDDAYLFDYVNNKVYKSNNAALNQFLIRRSHMQNMFIYKDEIYSYNLSSNVWISYPFYKKDFKLFITSIWATSSSVYYYVIAFTLLVFFVLGIVLLIQFIVKRKVEMIKYQLLKNKTPTQAFSETEIALINLLLQATKKGLLVEISQINHVLGIKDKNVGLQKKVRSDVMKAINDKYTLLTQFNGNLIGNRRKQDDKRFYEYFITASEIKTIQKIIENSEDKTQMS